MTSPFERTSHSVAEAVRTLELHAQVALFASVAQALSAAYRSWSEQSGSRFNGEVLDQAIESAMAFAVGESAIVDPLLLASVEANAPSGSSDAALYTAAQDCWIAADTALRGGLREFDPADSAWYLLEPQFQATSERLFGVSDPGSAVAGDAEAKALADPRLAEAIGVLGHAIRTLGTQPLTRDLLGELATQLGVLSP